MEDDDSGDSQPNEVPAFGPSCLRDGLDHMNATLLFDAPQAVLVPTRLAFYTGALTAMSLLFDTSGRQYISVSELNMRYEEIRKELHEEIQPKALPGAGQ